jgi:toxin FitB
VLAEIAQGVENNPVPDLRAFLADVRAMPIAEFGEAEALEWGRMTNAALKAGHSVQARDSMIAATAAVRGWTVATRNKADFQKLGVTVFDPWTDKL